MSSNLERLCQVDIEISRPIADNANFNTVLIVGPPPKSGKIVPPVTLYSSLNEATEAGYDATGDNADPVGTAIRVAFSQSPKPAQVYVATRQFSDKAVATDSLDPAELEFEGIGDTLARAAETDGWYVICPAGIPEELFEEMAEWTETQEKMFSYTTMSEKNPVNLIYYRSFGWYGREYVGQPDKDIPPANYCMHIAACAKILKYDSGSETWVHKDLAAVLPSRLKTAQAKELEAQHLNHLITVASCNITMHGQTCAGEWIDLIRFRDWLKNDMQVRVVNLMRTRKKIPYTDGGITLVQNQMISALKAGVVAGGISPDEYDEDGNLNPAFVTNVPIAASLTATERASRVLRKVSFQARIAGAIHMVEIAGNLSYENLKA